jgi:hypothetical protein
MRQPGADRPIVLLKRSNVRGGKGVGHRRRDLGSLSFGGTSRMNRKVQVRICEGLGVKVTGATPRLAKGDSVGQAHFIGELFGLSA